MSGRKTECIKFRLSVEEKEVLLHKAKQVSLPISEYLRRCGLNRRLPTPKGSQSEIHIRQQVRRVLKVTSKLVRRLKRNSDNGAVEETINALKEQAQTLEEVANKR